MNKAELESQLKILKASVKLSTNAPKIHYLKTVIKIYTNNLNKLNGEEK